jgi:DNA repair exonuclease SbcCD nuclease subunit
MVSLISDLHFGVRKNNEVYLKSQIKFIVEQFVPYLKENEINTIFILGDLFDNRSSTNTKVMNAVYEIFSDYLKDFTIYILVGNHDTYYNSNIEINSLKFLTKFENIHVIDKMTKIEIDNKKITLVPWVVDNVKFVREFHKTKCDVCMGHFNIHGFHFNKFKKSDDGIQAKLFSNCKKVFTGHFHIRNSQIINDIEMVYIGSPYQLTRNDIDECRGFTLLDLKDLSYKFIDNTKSLKYIKLKFPEKFSQSKIENNIIDVHVDYDNSYNENKVDNYIKKIEKFCPALPPNIFVDNNSELSGELNLENCNIGSMMDLMREYVDGLDIKNKEEIFKILIELYNEVKGEI